MKSTGVGNNERKQYRFSQAGINLILAFFAVLFYCVAKALFLNNSFYTNDQLVMRDIASGVYTGTPDGHLVYIMYTLGIVFKWLYSLMPSVKWYDLFMLAIHPACLALSVYYIAGSCRKTVGKIASTVAFIIVFISLNEWFIVMNEYTVNAGILCATGVLCLILANCEHVYSFIPSIVCFVMTLWLRRQMFLMMMPLILLVVCLKLITGKKKAIIISATITAIFCIASAGVEKIAYSSPEWKSFNVYNDARTDIVDFYGLPSYENMNEFLHGIGVSEAEYNALFHNIGLVSSIDADKLAKIAGESKRIHDIYNPVWPVSEVAKYNIRLAIHDLKGSLIGRLIALSAAFLGLASIIAFIKGSKARTVLSLLAGGASCIYTVAVLSVFTVIGRFPERISYPLYYANVLVLVGLILYVINRSSSVDGKYDCADNYAYANDEKANIEKANTEKTNSENSTVAKREHRYSLIYTIILTVYMLGAVALTFIMIPAIHRSVEDNASTWNQYIKEASVVQEYCCSSHDNVYYVDGSIANFGCDYMFDNTYITQDNYITLGYWTLGSELFGQRVGRALSGASDAQGEGLMKALADKDNIYFITPAESDLEWLACLIGSHFGDVEILRVDAFGTDMRGLEVYSVSKWRY